MIAIVVAMDKNGVISKNDRLEELKHFKELTIGHPIIMGRKTHETIGRELPGRVNIIVTRNAHYQCGHPNCRTTYSIEGAVALAEWLTASPNWVYVIGGIEIYRAALPYAERIHASIVDECADGDSFFPEINPEEWFCGMEQPRKGYTYYGYVRVRKSSRIPA